MLRFSRCLQYKRCYYLLPSVTRTAHETQRGSFASALCTAVLFCSGMFLGDLLRAYLPWQSDLDSTENLVSRRYFPDSECKKDTGVKWKLSRLAQEEIDQATKNGNQVFKTRKHMLNSTTGEVTEAILITTVLPNGLSKSKTFALERMNEDEMKDERTKARRSCETKLILNLGISKPWGF
mmetsp:Transcript_127209/g.231141  ORF Transcript_127209/g.231141 Transcript_127209/m.231141 type:complete len:180 (+) Transcript_127209:48-587(+)